MGVSLTVAGALLSQAPDSPLGRASEILFLCKNGMALTLQRGKALQSEVVETRLHLVSEKVSAYLAAASERKEKGLNLEEKVTFFLHADQLEQCNIRRNERIDKSVWLTILEVVVRIFTLFLVSLKQNLKNPLIDLPNKVDAFFGATPWQELLDAFEGHHQFPRALVSRLEHKILSAEQGLMTGEVKQNLPKVFHQFLALDNSFSIDKLSLEVEDVALQKRSKKVEEQRVSFDIAYLVKSGAEKFLFSSGKGESEAKVAFCKRGPIWEVLLHKQDSLFVRRYAALPDPGGDLFIRGEVERILEEIKGGGWTLHTPVVSSKRLF